MMTFASVNDTKKICRTIGEGLKDLRIENGYSSYENFAIEHDLSRMQYWRIEKGLTNITVKSLLTILNIHRVSLEDFFCAYLGHKPDNKSHKSAKSKRRKAKK